MVEGFDCFLDNEDWRAVLHHGSHPQGLNPHQSVRLSDEFYEILASLPGLVKWTNSLHKARYPNEAETPHVLQRASQLRVALVRWYRKLTTAGAPYAEIPSLVGDSLFPSVYFFENHHITGLISSYYASLIVINDILTSFPSTDDTSRDDLSSENITYAKEICKSVEYAHASGFQGAYSIIFPLTAAYVASGPEIRTWIKNWPRRFNEYFDVKVWKVFDKMAAKGGLIQKRGLGGSLTE